MRKFLFIVLIFISFIAHPESSVTPEGGQPVTPTPVEPVDRSFEHVFSLKEGDSQESITATFSCKSDSGRQWTTTDDTVMVVVDETVLVMPKTTDQEVTLSDGLNPPTKYTFTVKGVSAPAADTETKTKIAFLASNAYNNFTKETIYSNAEANGTTEKRGFLGGAFYNNNWVATDQYLFHDFSSDVTLLGEKSIFNAEILKDCLNWTPDFLILNCGGESEPLSAKAYVAASQALVYRVKNLLPETKVYVATPIKTDTSFPLILDTYVPKIQSTSLKGAERWIDLTSIFSSTETTPDRACNILGEALLFGFFEEAEKCAFPDKEQVNGLIPPCNPACGIIRDQNRVNTMKSKGSSITDLKFIMVGDSITHWWNEKLWNRRGPYGRSNWTANFGSGNSVDYSDVFINMGQASDTTADVLLRIQQGMLGTKESPINPEIAFIMIGTNNVGNGNDKVINYGGPDNSTQMAEGIVTVIDTVADYCQNAKLVWTKTLPTRVDYGMTRAKIENANRLVEAKLKEKAYYSRLTIVDMEESLTGIDGIPKADFYQTGEAPRLHLNEAGYDLWAPKLKEAANLK